MDTAHASDNRLSLFLSKAVIIYFAMQNKIMFVKEIVYALLLTCLLSIKNYYPDQNSMQHLFIFTVCGYISV